MPVAFPSDTTPRALFVAHLIVILIGIVLAIFIYRRRFSPQIVCRGWLLLWMCSFGVSLFSVCDTGLDRPAKSAEAERRDMSDEVVDFFGDLGVSVFFAAVCIRCWRLKCVIAINELKEVAHNETSSQVSMRERKRELRVQLSDKWAVQWFIILVLANMITNIFGFFRDYGHVFVVLDNIFFGTSVAIFMTAFIIFAVILRKIDDIFRQTSELSGLAFVALLIGVIEEYSFFTEDTGIALSSCIVIVNILAFMISLMFPLYLSYSSRKESGGRKPNPDASRTLVSADSSVPLLNSLESVILDLDGRKRFHDFLERAFALENLFFYESVLEFRAETSVDMLEQKAESMLKEYFEEDSPNELNIPGPIREQVVRDVRSKSTISTSLFDNAFRHIVQSIQLDLWPRFVKSREYRALSLRYDRRSVQLNEFRGLHHSAENLLAPLNQQS